MSIGTKQWPDLASRSLGAGVIYFTGNYPPEVSVEACGAEGYPSPAEPQLAHLLRAAGLPPAEAARRAGSRAGLADLPPSVREQFRLEPELSI